MTLVVFTKDIERQLFSSSRNWFSLICRWSDANETKPRKIKPTNSRGREGFFRLAAVGKSCTLDPEKTDCRAGWRRLTWRRQSKHFRRKEVARQPRAAVSAPFAASSTIWHLPLCVLASVKSELPHKGNALLHFLFVSPFSLLAGSLSPSESSVRHLFPCSQGNQLPTIPSGELLSFCGHGNACEWTRAFPPFCRSSLSLSLLYLRDGGTAWMMARLFRTQTGQRALFAAVISSLAKKGRVFFFFSFFFWERERVGSKQLILDSFTSFT